MRGDAHVPERRYWPNFLRGEPQEIHARLLENDPLRLRERCAVRLRERWLLIEPDRAFARAAATVALGVGLDDPPADLERWTLERIDKALDLLLEADRQAELVGDPPDQEQSTFPLLTDSLLVEPARVRAVALAFHALDPLSRRAFFELLIEGREVPDVLESGPWDADQLHDHVTSALRALGFDLPARTRSFTDVYRKAGQEAP